MSNKWFQFKQFRIEQDRCAMKVGTDGVILGAWSDVIGKYSRALDIGTGTGLLALMIAQRNPYLEIDAVEIDPEAALQARNNVVTSSFKNRINVQNRSFQDLLSSGEKHIYDLILCNPPYFKDSFKGVDNRRNISRHNDSLSLEMLFEGVNDILSGEGHFDLILPAHLYNEAEALTKNLGLNINRTLQVYPTPDKPVSRHCYEISKQSRPIKRLNLVIETGKRHDYSVEYKRLTDPFYL